MSKQPRKAPRSKARGKSDAPPEETTGGRIRMARIMAGHPQAKAFQEEYFPEWSAGRLSNYENGRSLPSPETIRQIGEATNTSPCWIAFGFGPIRSEGAQLQAIRHQNLVACMGRIEAGERRRIAQGAGETWEKLQGRAAKPLRSIGDRFARRFERTLGKPRGWMDEQHVDRDGLCDAFPEPLRELMMIYDELDARGRAALLGTAKVLRDELSSAGVNDGKS